MAWAAASSSLRSAALAPPARTCTVNRARSSRAWRASWVVTRTAPITASTMVKASSAQIDATVRSIRLRVRTLSVMCPSPGYASVRVAR